MADEQQELRRVHWNEFFSFPQIFKSFRMAIQPSKLLLALAAIILIFVGGWVMDLFWGLGNQYVRPGEIYGHFCTNSAQLEEAKEQWEKQRPDEIARFRQGGYAEWQSLASFLTYLDEGVYKQTFKELLGKIKDDTKAPEYDELVKEAKKNWGKALGKVEDVFDDEVEKIEEIMKECEDEAEKVIDKADLAKDKKEEALEALEKHARGAKQALTKRKVKFYGDVEDIRGRPLFASLLEYETMCVRNAISAVRNGRIFTGLGDYRAKRGGKAIPPLAAKDAQQVKVQSIDAPAADEISAKAGFLYWMLLAFHAVIWLLCEHWIYAVIFLIFCLAVCALFGGAVNRIAAVHFARDEKISMAQALKFSAGKFLSFFTAPLIPILIILLIALFLFVGGLVGSIPYVGEIIMAVLFFLAILAGLAIAFLLVGLAGGGGLMYPTIAVEGSDSFDAISRSFTYVFARPWRAVLYGLVALVYGVITYIFVRLFAFLALASTHYFVKWGVFGWGGALHAEADKLDVIWTAPSFHSLFGPFSWQAMNGTQAIAAFIIGVWVFLIAGMVAAYILTYLASSTTVIYYLLRRKVDATDLDDVYVEEPEEEPLPVPEGEEPAPAEGEAEGPADEGGEEEKKEP